MKRKARYPVQISDPALHDRAKRMATALRIPLHVFVENAIAREIVRLSAPDFRHVSADSDAIGGQQL